MRAFRRPSQVMNSMTRSIEFQKMTTCDVVSNPYIFPLRDTNILWLRLVGYLDRGVKTCRLTL
jgi:hypothetical protein